MRKRSKFLTPAERNVVILLCEEFCVKSIARFLDLEVRTIQTHCERVYRKTGCTKIAQLIRWAIQNHIYYMPGFPFVKKRYCAHCGAEVTEQ